MKRFTLRLILLFIGIPLQISYAQETVGVTPEEIKAYPEPNVTRLYGNTTLINDRIYRRVNDAIEIYDAPNGDYKSTLGQGFNFVTVLQFMDGWAEISQDAWVRADQLNEDVAQSTYAGVLLPEESLPYTAAWVLVNLYPSRTPGGDPSEANELLLRYTLVNIYTSVELDGWRWYQVGDDQWVHQTKVAKILPLERNEEINTEKWVSVDLYEQVAIAYEGETPVYATLISSGLADWPTNEGLFHIYVRYPRAIMSGGFDQPDFYYLEEVPWTMYFDEDIALHGAYWHDGFGYRRSHGCVNMSITDAHWLYEFTASEFDFEVANDTGAAVLVYSSDDYK